jgi:branched-chain amino acid aminotransferase
MASVYLDGTLVDEGAARIAPDDRGFLLGDGLFETLRARGGSFFRPRAHLDRLAASAERLGIPLPEDIDVLERALSATLAANRLEAADAVVRLTLTRGAGPRGVLPPDKPTPTLLIAAYPLEAPPGAPGPAPGTPATLHTVNEIRRNERSPLATLKSLNYLDGVLARSAAHGAGADEALLLNTKGRIAEASAANFFLVENGDLATPPPSEGVLPGITRAVVLELADELGLPVREEPLEPGRIETAAEGFLTNAVIGLRPVGAVDANQFAAPGPVTVSLVAAFDALVARETGVSG